MMKKILYILVLALAVGCDKEEVHVNTGPLFVSTIEYEGVDFASGTAYTATLADNANDVPVNASFTVLFSKSVNPGTITSENVKLLAGADELAIDLNVNDTELIITPSELLKNNEVYQLVLTNAIKSTDGGLIAEAGNFGGVTRTLNTVGDPPYVPEGQVAYWSFNFDYEEHISKTMSTVVGDPGFANTSAGGPNAFASTEGSYLTFPTAGILNDEFSATFWYKVNPSPDRAGILVIGPPDEANPDAMNNRSSGFRFFRENAGGKQRFKLNVGNGTTDTWFDGGAAADVDPATEDWVHFAFTISPTECVVYINGEIAKQGAFDGVDWTGCDILSIGSGAPRFTGWGHLSDQSFLDELRIFNKALTQAEIQAMMDAG